MPEYTEEEQKAAAKNAAVELFIVIMKHAHECNDCSLALTAILYHADPNAKLPKKYDSYVKQDMHKFDKDAAK